MTTLSLGSGLVTKITNTVFSNGASFETGGGYQNNAATTNATNTGMGGSGYNTTDAYGNPLYYQLPAYFSLMKGTVPSQISDISSNQRSSDELVRFTGPSYGKGSYVNADAATATSAILYNGSNMYSANDFLITVSGNTATWSSLNASFLPRSPLASGTPTWFWFRINNAGGTPVHNIFGTVGASGSGSDLELANYAAIDASKQYTLYNATMAVFSVINYANY